MEDVAVTYCDLDGFKSVNDRFGHEEGDRVLELAAGRLAGAVRGGDLVARLGGDEFAVLIQGPRAGSRAATVAARIVSALQSPLVADGTVLAVSASLGVSCTNGRAEVPATLLRSADQAMYQAKRAGGNRFVVAEHDEDRSASLPRPAPVSPSSAPVVSGR
jgi:diguanylate cyclase (GGDEF)-like protein